MKDSDRSALGYTLVSYLVGDLPRAGIAVDGNIFGVAEVTGSMSYVTMLDVLQNWEAARNLLGEGAANAGKGSVCGVPLEKAVLLAPVLYPSAIFCAGANYSDHVLEMAEANKTAPEPDPRSLGLKPFHFMKASRSVVGTQSIVSLPCGSKMLDWEGELAAVIGRVARDVPVEDALNYVAGYTVANDLSARDLTTRPNVPVGSPFHYDWVGQKSFDSSCPLGPWIVPAAAIPEPQNLGIRLWVNDVLKQDSNTSKMIFTLAEQIAHLSTRITLYPGDVILTGTPAGVGLARREFLKPGDVVRVWIEQVGTLTTTMA